MTDSKVNTSHGATLDEGAAISRSVFLPDVLPIVCDPTAEIAEGSTMKVSAIEAAPS